MATPLEDRIAVLEQLVADLRAELARPPRRDSMKQTFTCPCCGGGAFFGIKQVDEYTDSGMVPLSLGNRGIGWRGAKLGDPLQAYVCKNCHFVEWHVASFEHLKPDGEKILEFTRPDDATPSRDPYR
jgi:hypothetical protein